MRTAYKALPTSKSEIAEYARSLRRNVGLENEFFFPVMEYLEIFLQDKLMDMTLDIVPLSDMPFKEGGNDPRPEYDSDT